MKKAFVVFTVLLILSMALPVAAQETGPGAAVDQGKMGGKTVYVVRMAMEPVVAYQGDVAGLAATSAADGEEINFQSAAVEAYTSFLAKTHATTMAQAGVDSFGAGVQLFLRVERLCGHDDRRAGGASCQAARRGGCERRSSCARRPRMLPPPSWG